MYIFKIKLFKIKNSTHFVYLIYGKFTFRILRPREKRQLHIVNVINAKSILLNFELLLVINLNHRNITEIFRDTELYFKISNFLNISL